MRVRFKCSCPVKINQPRPNIKSVSACVGLDLSTFVLHWSPSLMVIIGGPSHIHYSYIFLTELLYINSLQHVKLTNKDPKS